MPQQTRGKGPGSPIRDASAPVLASAVTPASAGNGAWVYVGRTDGITVEMVYTSDATASGVISIEGAEDSSGTGKVVLGAFGNVAVSQTAKVLKLRLGMTYRPFMRWAIGTVVGVISATTITVHAEHDAMSPTETAGVADAS